MGIWCSGCRQWHNWKAVDIEWEYRQSVVYRQWWCPFQDILIREEVI